MWLLYLSQKSWMMCIETVTSNALRKLSRDSVLWCMARLGTKINSYNYWRAHSYN